MKRLFCAMLVTAAALSPAAAAPPDDALLERLGAARSIRLVVEQSYTYMERSAYVKKEIAGYGLPFARVARYLLEEAGLRVIEAGDGDGDAATDATLAITVRGRAISRLYIDQFEGYLYTGAEIIGEIVFSAPGATPWRTEFRSQHGPPFNVQINLGFDQPEGAPFAEAFDGPTSFVARYAEAVGQIFGAPPLIAALDGRSAAVRLHAARVLGAIGGAGVGEALLAALEGRDAGLRKEAAWSLGRLRDASAVHALTIALDDSDGDVRWFAAWALSRIGEAAAAGSDPSTEASASVGN
jgi:hypothetical protein